MADSAWLSLPVAALLVPDSEAVLPLELPPPLHPAKAEQSSKLASNVEKTLFAFLDMRYTSQKVFQMVSCLLFTP